MGYALSPLKDLKPMQAADRTTYRIRKGSLFIESPLSPPEPIPELWFSPHDWCYYLFHGLDALLIYTCIDQPREWRLRAKRWERSRAQEYWNCERHLWSPFLAFWAERKPQLFELPVCGYAGRKIYLALAHATARIPGTLLRWELRIDLDECLASVRGLVSALEQR